MRIPYAPSVPFERLRVLSLKNRFAADSISVVAPRWAAWRNAYIPWLWPKTGKIVCRDTFGANPPMAFDATLKVEETSKLATSAEANGGIRKMESCNPSWINWPGARLRRVEQTRA